MDMDMNRSSDMDRDFLQSIFEQIDTDKSHTLDISEFKALFTKVMDQMDNTSEISDADLQQILDRLDTNRDGEIDMNEFVSAFHGINGIDELIDTSYLHLLFSKIDKNRNDIIERDEILELFENETEMTPSDKLKILDIIDCNHDGAIDFSEFKSAFRKLACRSTSDLLQKSYLHLIFNKLDNNRNRLLELGEWQDMFNEQGIYLSEHEVQRLFEVLDESGDGEVDFYEFEDKFKTIKSIGDLIKKSRLHVIFNNIDTDGSRGLDFEEIKLLFATEKVDIPDDQLRNLLNVVDENNDGIIQFEEFENAFDQIENIHDLVNQWQSMTSIDVGSDLSISSHLHYDENSTFSEAILPILAGGTGGICSRTITAPLERVKIMGQCGTTTSSILRTWADIIETQGIFRGLWRGNFYNCLRVFPFGGIVCFTYGTAMKKLKLSADDHIWRFGAGCLAGSIATTATYPLDVIRTRITASLGGEKINLRSFTAGGLQSMFTGLWPTLFAMSLFVGFQNMTYDYARIYATSPEYLNIRPSVELFIFCGMSAGVAAQTIVYPLDVVRRRIQNQSTGETNMTKNLQQNITRTMSQKNTMSNATWLALRNVVQKEGARSLFAGLVPTYLKVMPSVAISVTIRDIMLGRLE